MAEDKTSTETKKEPAKDKEPAEEKVERARLVNQSYEFFGVGPHVVAGALHGLDRRATAFTPSEAQAEIEKFLKRKVKEA